jgi:hypothetical protein
MRSEPDQLESILIGLAINEHKIGFDVAVPEVFPIAAERMIGNAASTASSDIMTVNSRSNSSRYFRDLPDFSGL